MAITQEQVLDSNEDTGPVVVGGGGDSAPRARQALSIAPGDYAPAAESKSSGLSSGQDFTPRNSQPDVDVTTTPERQNFDKDIAYAKKSMYINPDDNQMYSNERGLGPSINAARLDKRGIDVPALVGKIGHKTGGSIKNYTDKSGRLNLGSGRVSTASKGKSNPSW